MKPRPPRAVLSFFALGFAVWLAAFAGCRERPEDAKPKPSTTKADAQAWGEREAAKRGYIDPNVDTHCGPRPHLCRVTMQRNDRGRVAFDVECRGGRCRGVYLPPRPKRIQTFD